LYPSLGSIYKELTVKEACHRDNFSLKTSGRVTGWLRQVTQPPLIAVPLKAFSE
jgi:hypothetical protein